MNNYSRRAGAAAVRSAQRIIGKFACAAFICASLAGFAEADPDRFPKLRVEKNPKDKTGPALVTINGKNKVLARNAIQAWPVMDGENALVIVTAPKKPSGIDYRLRFYEGDSRKYRDLGKMNFPATGFSEAKQSDGTWVFVFTGMYLDKPTIVIAGLNSIHGELRNASEPKLHEDSIKFLDANGNPKTLPVAPLIAADMTNESRRFLVKQGHNSVVAELNLSGFDDELAVLSGRTATVEVLDRVRAMVGDDPDVWLPVFHKERRI